jgi:hypothetical protein
MRESQVAAKTFALRILFICFYGLYISANQLSKV